MTTSAPSIEAVTTALSDIREMFEADGYALTVDGLVGSTVNVTVLATDAACADCLAPRSVVAQIMLNDLAAVGGVDRVELTYPEESAAH